MSEDLSPLVQAPSSENEGVEESRPLINASGAKDASPNVPLPEVQISTTGGKGILEALSPEFLSSSIQQTVTISFTVIFANCETLSARGSPGC